MNTFILPLLLLASLPADDAAASSERETSDRQTVLIVVGAEGAAEFGAEFRKWATLWEEAAGKAGAHIVRIGVEKAGDATDRDGLEQAIAGAGGPALEALWIILIGHGTFDGREAKLNLRGPDVTAAQLAEWLKPLQRPVAVINCASSSGPFINRLSAPNRVVVTATKSGFEHNYARFGGEVAAAITDPIADLDKDGQTSLLEAFLLASARTEEFYRADGRLVTEHAVVDDNGDGRGTPAAWFRGVRVTREAKDAAPDGFRANQFHLVRSQRDIGLSAGTRARRDELELRIENLRQRKSELAEDAYYDLLEPLLIELARLYAE